MPIFEYRCEECGETFEYLVMGAAEPQCPCCCSPKVCKLMSACGFTSKGGGETVRRSAGASSCGGCSASSCAGCGH